MGGGIMDSMFGRLMAGVAAVLIVLGTVSIIMSFSAKWYGARIPGAIFFVGGCLLVELLCLASQQGKILDALSDKRES